MAQWCDSCGQQLPHGETVTDATWLGAPGDSQKPSFTKPSGASRSGNEKKVLLAVLGAVAVWGLFVGLGQITTPDDTIDEQAAADIEQAQIERQEQEAAREAEEAEKQARADALEADRAAERAADVDGDYAAADAAPGFPVESEEGQLTAVGTREGDAIVTDATNLGARTAVTVQVERLQRQLTRRSSAPFVAYRSAGGVAVVDMISGIGVLVGVEDDIKTAQAGTHILRSGGSSFAIDPSDQQIALVGADSSLVVSQALDGSTYFVDARSLSGQSSIVEVVDDGEYKFHRMPAGGFQLQPVDGLGLLAVPKGPTGETLIAEADNFRTLSTNRVITGTSQALLEQVCRDEATCSLVITNIESGEQTAVPPSFVRFGDRYSLAPDGSALLRYSPEGFAEVFVAGTDSIAWVIGAGMRGPAWGPNSDFIVWIDRIGDPKLKVMFPDERDWLSIDLRDLLAPPPSGPELIVFEEGQAGAESTPADAN